MNLHMKLQRIVLKNWRNFKKLDVSLKDRMFVVGPNAAGKSNFLDAFRFMRDVVKSGGGLQQAIADRGGISKVRCLSARNNPKIEFEFYFSEDEGENPSFIYRLGIAQETRGHREVLVAYEKVTNASGKDLVSRPDKDDKQDKRRLTQSFLEQISANREFRDIADFFQDVLYIHLVPQILKFPDLYTAHKSEDPYGRSFLERIARTPKRTRQSRLKKIENALRHVVPQFEELRFEQDEMGNPHLEATYKHWRARGSKQRETEFSDGTLRLIGLFWSLLESNALLLLEEPELSLHSEVVRRLAPIIYRLSKTRQVIISTHSRVFLEDRGIGAEEILLLVPGSDGTSSYPAANRKDIRDLIENGLSLADAIVPLTTPTNVSELTQMQFALN